MPLARVLLPLLAAAAVALAVAASSSAAPSASRCPAGDRHAPVSSRPGAGGRLVPAGARTLLLCRYSGLNAPAALTLTAHRLVSDRATVARLGRELNSLRPTSRVIFACPAGTGTAIVARFRYASGPPDPVTIELNGCNTASNGRVHRLAGVSATGRAVVAQLERLTRGG